jgi:hypothetical protein
MIPDVAGTIEVVYDGSGPAADIFSLFSDEHLRLAGGTFTISGDGQSTISTLTLEGTVFATSEDLIVLQTFDIRGGAVRGPGDIIVPGLVVIDGGTTILEDTQWRLEGGVEWRDGQLVSRTTTITLVAGTQFNSTGPADRSLTGESGVNQFVVGGAFQHSGAGAVTFTQATGASLEVNVASGGSVNVQAGRLVMDAGGASFGGYDAATDAIAQWLRDYTHAAGSSITGDGDFIFDSGVHAIEGGISVSNSVTIGKTAVVQLRTDQTIDAAMLIIGELSSDGLLTLTSDVEIQSGSTLSGAGSVTLGLTARTDIQSGVHKAPANLRIDVLNLGVTRWIDTDVVQDGAEWTDAPSASFFAFADASWTGLNSAIHAVSDGATMTIDTAGTATFTGDHTLVLRGRLETINGQTVFTNIIVDGAEVQGGVFDVTDTLTIEGDMTTFDMTQWRITNLAMTDVDVEGRDAILTITTRVDVNSTAQPVNFSAVGGASQFNIEGTGVKTGPGAATFTEAGGSLEFNVGAGAQLDIQGGSLQVDAIGVNAGVIDTAMGTVSEWFQDYLHAAGSFLSGAGLFRFADGVHRIEGEVDASSAIEVDTPAHLTLTMERLTISSFTLDGVVDGDAEMRPTESVTLRFGARLANSGGVVVQSGAEMWLEPGTGAGDITIESDVLIQAGGMLFWLDAGVQQLRSAITIEGGAFSVLADNTWTGVDGATIDLDAAATMTVDTPGAARFAGDHTLVLRGRLETINGRTTLSNIMIDGGGILRGTFDVIDTLTLEGETTTFDGTQWRITNLEVTDVDIEGRDAQITISAGTITNNTLQPMEFRGLGGTNQFTVESSLTKTGAGSMSFVDAGAPVPVTIAPGASVEVQQGSLGWVSSAAIDGAVTIRDLAVLQLGGAVQAFITAQLFLEGRLEVLGGITNLFVGSLTGGGVLAIAPGARAELQSDAGAGPLLAAAEVAGDLAISGAVTLGGSATVAPGGRLTAEGIVLAITAAMRIEELGLVQAGDFRADGRLDIAGAADLNSLLVGGSISITGGVLNVINDILIEPSGSLAGTDDASARANSLRNDGSLELRRGADLRIDTNIVNIGDMDVQDALVAAPVFSSTGQSRLLLDSARSFGAGRFELLDQSQAIARRTPFLVSGDYTQGAEATLVLEIGAEEPPDARLTVGGQAQLAGTLVARYIDGYAPVEGTRLRIIEADSIVGAFDTVTLPVAPPGDKSLLIEGPTFLEILSTDLADMNGDGVLDFFDFLTFQDLFALGDPLADLNGDGVLDFFDFLTFQSFFGDG